MFVNFIWFHTQILEKLCNSDQQITAFIKLIKELSTMYRFWIRISDCGKKLLSKWALLLFIQKEPSWIQFRKRGERVSRVSSQCWWKNKLIHFLIGFTPQYQPSPAVLLNGNLIFCSKKKMKLIFRYKFNKVRSN